MLATDPKSKVEYTCLFIYRAYFWGDNLFVRIRRFDFLNLSYLSGERNVCAVNINIIHMWSMYELNLLIVSVKDAISQETWGLIDNIIFVEGGYLWWLIISNN